MLMLSLHNLSKEYGTLPGETLSRATTFDMQVLNIATRWENKKYQEANPEAKKELPKLTQEQMLAMVKKAKEKK